MKNIFILDSYKADTTIKSLVVYKAFSLKVKELKAVELEAEELLKMQ